MAHSIAIHAALLWVIGALIVQISNPPLSNLVLDISLETAQSDQPVAAPSEQTEPSPAGQLPSEEPVSVAPDTAEPVPSPDEPAKLAGNDPLIDVVAEVEPLAEPDPEPTVDPPIQVEPHRVVAVPAADAWIPLSRKQHKMLERRIQRVANNFDKYSRREDGWRWKHRGQEYVAQFRELPAEDDMSPDRAIVAITTEANGQQFATEVLMKRLAFSNYAQFVHRWDPNVEIHNDELDGRFHANSKLVLSYDRKVQPKFLGKVTTAAREVDVAESLVRVRRRDIFVGGLETGVREIRLPNHYSPLPDDSDISRTQVHYFNRHTRITLHADGTYAWHALDATSGEQRRAFTDNSFYMMGAKGARFHVSGTVNGTVLIYSREDIVIEGNLFYAQDPRSSPESDDFLGLVSEKNVAIADPQITGPGDLMIQASIYAKRRFTVRAYGSRTGGLMQIYGSVVAGSLSATEPRYSTKVTFDKRLHERRPPGFPVTDRYEVEAWNQTWQIR